MRKIRTNPLGKTRDERETCFKGAGNRDVKYDRQKRSEL